MVKERNEHFVLYASMFNTFSLLREKRSVQEACDYIEAIMAYGFDNILPKQDSPVWLYGFEKDKISIDNAQARYEKSQVNGSKGGRKKTEIDIDKLCRLKETTKMTWDEIANEFLPLSTRTLQRYYKDYKEQKKQMTERGDEVLNFDNDKNTTNATELQCEMRQTENSFVAECDKTTKRQNRDKTSSNDKRQNDKTTKSRQYLSISISNSNSMSNSILFPPDGGNVVPSDKMTPPLVLSNDSDKTLEQENATITTKLPERDEKNATQCDKTPKPDEKSATIMTKLPTISNDAPINEENIYTILNTCSRDNNLLNQILMARKKHNLSLDWIIDEDEQGPKLLNEKTGQSWLFSEEA